MSPRRAYSGRRYRRRRSPLPALLLVIVLAVTFIQFRGEKKWVNYM